MKYRILQEQYEADKIALNNIINKNKDSSDRRIKELEEANSKLSIEIEEVKAVAEVKENIASTSTNNVTQLAAGYTLSPLYINNL